jgi:hypothetical protein
VPMLGGSSSVVKILPLFFYLALVMEALSKEQGAAIVAGTRKVAGRAFLGWLAVSLR